MIHPLAHFNAANTAAETLQERIALLERPVVEFGMFLQARRSVPAAAEVPGAISRVIEARSPEVSQAELFVASSSVPRARETQPAAGISQGTTHSVQLPAAGLAIEHGSESAPAAANGGSPRFADVPDSAKYPAGPYRQAPPEYGGEWWPVNPFTGSEPWRTHAALVGSAINRVSRFATENLPAGFQDAFGELPTRRAGESGGEFTGRLARWKQDLEFFQHGGIPDGFDESQVELAGATYEQWGLGRPVFYEGRYGWFARFPGSAIPEFEMDAASAVGAAHLAIARFQARLLREGGEVATPHPFVPPHLLTETEDT